VKTSSGKVVAASFLYLMVHRWIAGDVHIYLKYALKVTLTLQTTLTITPPKVNWKFQCQLQQCTQSQSAPDFIQICSLSV